jgi:hypothetical protein
MNLIATVIVSSGLIIGLAGPGWAQDQSTPAADPRATQNPAMKSPDNMTQAPLAKGKNSFNKAQAVARMHSAGYKHVMGLTKDTDGLWHAHAMYKGQRVNVALDYKGNVASE